MKVYFLITLTLVIFISRNVVRINKEYRIYDYDIITKPFYRSEEQNFSIFNKIDIINNCMEKVISAMCIDQNYRLKKINNFKIYYRKK